MKLPIPTKKVRLLQSQFLRIIEVEGRKGNLALTTVVSVDTDTNKCELVYKVRSWTITPAHQKLSREFKTYKDAFQYCVKVYNEYCPKE